MACIETTGDRQLQAPKEDLMALWLHDSLGCDRAKPEGHGSGAVRHA